LNKHEELYNQIPTFKCKERCNDCCGPIPFTKWEWNRVSDKRETKGLTCPYSSKNGCDIYEQRPLICRLYGTVKKMQCPHGCRPIGLLSEEQEQAIMKEYFELVEANV
jgi:Fe-S-cluster containining protein